VRPVDVDLHLEVDASRSLAFRGEVAISLELDRPRRSLEIHAAELRVRDPRVESARGLWSGQVRLRPERETAVIHLPRTLPAGSATLHLRFSGRLRSDLKGFYLARSGERRYALTQLAATHARRMFPCFDEPALKARFRISVTTGAGNRVVSNQPVERVRAQDDGRRTWHFSRTPRLSSYLIAVAVGAFERTPPVHVGKTPIRVYCVPGKEGLADFGLAAARQSLTRLERWFGLPYPYEKLDLVAVPDFEFGAMENAGAVFFRETALLLQPGAATSSEQRRVAEIVCHELSHMWFGNLVTMAWWDDLWLNESFATWMAFHIVDSWKPQWLMWREFQHGRAAALGADSMRDTHSVYTEVRNPEEATENFDLITYEKGAAIVRMLERHLGASVFRRGVRRYIRRHREGNARAADLWGALAEAAGKPVAPLVRAWISQRGYPVVHLARSRDGRSLRLRQAPFPAPRRGDPQRWPIPWTGRIGTRSGGSRILTQLFRAATARVAIARSAPFLYGNADESGFYRCFHDASELARLANHLERLSVVERMGLADHAFAAVFRGGAPLAPYLTLAERLGTEKDPAVLTTLSVALSFLARRVAEPAGDAPAAAFRSWLALTFAPALRRLGTTPRRSESNDQSARRSVLLRLLGESGAYEPAQRWAREACDGYLRDTASLDPSLADVAVTLAAQAGGVGLHRRLLRGWQRAETPQQARRLLMAMAEMRAESPLDATISLCLDARVAGGDVALLLARLLRNPAASGRTWRFVKRRWPRVSRRMGAMMVTRFIDATPSLASAAARDDVARFFATHPVPTGKRAVHQALERFDQELAFEARAGQELTAWLAGGSAAPKR